MPFYFNFDVHRFLCNPPDNNKELHKLMVTILFGKERQKITYR